MNIKETSLISLVGSLVFCGIMGMAGKDMYKELQAKATAQHSAVSSLREWKRQYSALLPVEQKWNTTLSKFSDFNDLYQLHSKLNEDGMGIDADKLTASKIERLKEGTVDLGAQKVCMAYSGSPFRLTAASHTELQSKLTKFLARPDIDVGTIAFTPSKDAKTVSVTLDPMCLILRDDGNGETK